MREAVIVEAVRTPIGRRNGKLKDIHPVVLGSLVLKEVVRRAGIEPQQVEDVVFGCVSQAGEQSLNVGRNAWLTAGFPVTTPATTVDRQCGSSQQAIHFAANLIQSGICDVTIAGGVESMSRVPMGSNAIQPGHPFPPELMELYDLVPQGISAELIARKYKVSRKEMDEFGVESHHRAHEATEKGYMRSQIMPVDVPVEGNGHVDVFERDEGIRANASYEAAAAMAGWRLADEIVTVAAVGEDGCPRPDTTLAGLAALEPAFVRDGTVTAGTSSPLTDGAAAVLVTSERFAREHGLEPLARVRSVAVSGCEPEVMGIGPVQATRKAVERAGIVVEELDVVELNEAFASVVLQTTRALKIDPDLVNVNGGAIALGHPLGATGAMLFGTALDELERSGKHTALITMCIGGGQGIATIIERM